jgi:carbamoyl-phosphate synthase large subunit
VLVEESVLGWKEFELEVIRDHHDNAIVICSVENFDAMGVHTGDSITVAPQQTLTDREYQAMRDDAFAVIRRVGVATGGSNIQFAVDPENGDRIVIEMNPRVSRSSALASKATGFPIAKVAALLAVGYTLDEIPNDITGKTFAAFEPSLDYTVVKIPRWAFEKFPAAPGARHLDEVGGRGDGDRRHLRRGADEGARVARARRHARQPRGAGGRSGAPAPAPGGAQLGAPVRRLRRAAPGLVGRGALRVTHVDPWFLREIRDLVELETELACWDLGSVPAALLRAPSERPRTRGSRSCSTRRSPRSRRASRARGSAASSSASTPAPPSSRPRRRTSTRPTAAEDEAEPTDRRKVMILGSGPNRIGQGIEFDYCCVHAAFALSKAGYETIMVNCNPETVSTDYDTSDRLYFEPLTIEHVMAIVERERPEGVIVQLGGQTPLKLAQGLAARGVPISAPRPTPSTSPRTASASARLLAAQGIRQPENGTARTLDEALAVARGLGFPVLVRPVATCSAAGRWRSATTRRCSRASWARRRRSPTATRCCSTASSRTPPSSTSTSSPTAERAVVCGILQHIEEAGVHSGDSAAVLPPHTATAAEVARCARSRSSWRSGSTCAA